MRQVVMTVEEQLAAALAEVENLRTALADKEAAIAGKNRMIRVSRTSFCGSARRSSAG